MIENALSLLPKNLSESSNVIAVGSDADSLEELLDLLQTLSLTSYKFLISLRQIVSSTYIGSGQLHSIGQLVEEKKAACVIFDYELAPNQLRNCEAALKTSVLDRPGVIIEIFSKNARTKEAKTQIALARLTYLLPRLTHFWSHFERQRGGGSISRGMGEKQIEVDRRLVKNRMTQLKRQLNQISKERSVRRNPRKELLKIAIVGYTNAGKSTLLNNLTHSTVLAENKLFATLDSSCRILDPASSPPVVIIDTVGFIRNLPPFLIASFRSTLEEIFEADLLCHVVDASNPNLKTHIQVTLSILKELGLQHKPIITVLNKCDLVLEKSAQLQLKVIAPGALLVSSLQEKDVLALRDVLLNSLRKDLETVELLLPYDQSKLEAKLYEVACVEQKRFLEKGTFLKIRVSQLWIKKLYLKRYLL